MSKIERYQGNVQAFALNAQGLERTVFGGTEQANDLTSQVTAAFLRGWGIVGPSEHPSLEDFNAAMYAMSQFIAYQHQVGVPEWHAEQEYNTGSVCVRSGEAYISLSDSNVGSAPPSAKWTLALTVKNATANISGFLKTSNNLSEIATTGTAAQIAAAKLAARTNIGLESVIGQLVNGGTFASCTSNGYYLVSITDPSSVTDMPKFNGVNALGSGFLFVSKSETSICQTYISSNGGECSRFKLGSGSFTVWDFKFSAIYKPTSTNLSLGTASDRNVGTGANQIPDMSSFASGDGWIKYPNSKILQYGYVTLGSTTHVDFPIPFPSKCSSIVCGGGHLNASAVAVQNFYNVTTSGFDVKNQTVLNNATAFYWQAIGE